MARVFVSYRRVGPDDRIAMAMYRRLSDLGHDVFLDSERVQIGRQWPSTIAEAVARTEWFVAIVSTSYLDRDHCVVDELAPAARRLRRGDLAGFLPVHLGIAAGLRYPAGVADVLEDVQAFQWRGEADTAAAIEDVVAALPHPTSLVKGMLAFDVLDASGFRDLGRAELAARCRDELARPGAVVVHGVSGAGKTSFLRAGVLAELPAGSWQLVTATAADTIDPAAAAGGAAMLVIDQFEQTVVAAAREPAIATRFEDAALAWLTGERRLVLVIRDEYRTSLEAMFPRLGRTARGFPVFPLAKAAAAAALAAILTSARVDFDRAVLDGVIDRLADGAPVTVRPALLQLAAQRAATDGDRFGTDATSMFERHVRAAVLDALPASIARLDAARALQALTAGELKSSPHALDEIARDAGLTPAVAQRVLDLAGAPHARVATAHLHGESERFELVHDLFAGAIQALVRAETTRAASRRTVWTATVLVVMAALVATAFSLLWRSAESARQIALAQARREKAVRLAALAEHDPGDSPGPALTLAVEALDATAPDPAVAEAMRATYLALARSVGPVLPGSLPLHAAGTPPAVAVAASSRRAAVLDDEGGLQIWSLAVRDAAPVRLTNPGVRSLAFAGDDRLLAWSEHLWSWDLATGSPDPTPIGQSASGFAISADHTRLIGADADGLQIWSLDEPSQPAARILGAPPAITGAFVSPRGRWLAIPRGDGYALVETETPQVTDVARADLADGVAPPAATLDIVAISDVPMIFAIVDHRRRRRLVQLMPHQGDWVELPVIHNPELARDRIVATSWIETEAGTWELLVQQNDGLDACVMRGELGIGCIAAQDVAGATFAARRGWHVGALGIDHFRGDIADQRLRRFMDDVIWTGRIGDAGVDAAGTVAVAQGLDGAVVVHRDHKADGRRWTGLPPAPPLHPTAPPSTTATSPDRRWRVTWDDGLWIAKLDTAGAPGGRARLLATVAAVDELVFRRDSRQLAARAGTAVMTWDVDVFEHGGEPSLSDSDAPAASDGALAYADDFLVVVSPTGALLAVWPTTAAHLREQALRHGARITGSPP